MSLFIVFEGVEGSGKTTQARTLHRRLGRLGYPSLLVHEPGGTPTGEKVRRWLKSGKDITPLAEVFLFAAARAAIVEQKIRPALARWDTVICDRYIYSTLAYQGYARGMDLGLLKELNRIATQGLVPDLVVLLDVPFEEGMARKGQPGDRFEREDASFHHRVREGYLSLAREEPERWLVLDATASRRKLAGQIARKVVGLLDPQKN